MITASTRTTPKQVRDAWALIAPEINELFPILNWEPAPKLYTQDDETSVFAEGILPGDTIIQVERRPFCLFIRFFVKDGDQRRELSHRLYFGTVAGCDYTDWCLSFPPDGDQGEGEEAMCLLIAINYGPLQGSPTRDWATEFGRMSSFAPGLHDFSERIDTLNRAWGKRVALQQ